MRSVLYFPYLSPEEEWLRSAALMWDDVYVFSTRRPRPWPDDIRRVDDALGGILRPQRLDLLGESIQASFWSWLDEFTAFRVDADTTPTATSIEAEAAFEELYNDKFTDALLGDLVRRGLARKQAIGNNAMVSLPTDVVNYYLSACAGAFVDMFHKCDLFADSASCASVALRGRPSLTGSLSTALMNAHLPGNVATMPLDVLAAIRRDLAAERLELQNEIEKVVDSAARVSDPSDMADLQNTVTSLAEKQIQRTVAIYRRANSAAVMKSLGAALVPGSISWIASMLGTSVFAPAAAAAGLALLGATFISDRRKANEEFGSSGWSYFSQVSRSVESTSVFETHRPSDRGRRRSFRK